MKKPKGEKNKPDMLHDFISREGLYEVIDRKIKSLGFKSTDYPLDALKIAGSITDLHIEDWEFQSNHICGMLYKGEFESTIYLNTKRSDKGRNFDCMHELIHYWFHPQDQYLCFHEDEIKQDLLKEWQANEGAAQALMPRDMFIHRYYQYRGNTVVLSDLFGVGETAVRFRIQNLKREILLLKAKYRQFELDSFANFFVRGIG